MDKLDIDKLDIDGFGIENDRTDVDSWGDGDGYGDGCGNGRGFGYGDGDGHGFGYGYFISSVNIYMVETYGQGQDDHFSENDGNWYPSDF